MGSLVTFSISAGDSPLEGSYGREAREPALRLLSIMELPERTGRAGHLGDRVGRMWRRNRHKQL